MPIRQQCGQFRAVGNSPTTLAGYLTSIAKASWYSIFEAGSGMFQSSNGTGAVVSGDPVGCWAPVLQVGAAFKFIQPTSASRPTFSTTQYALPTIYGNGSSHTLYTDSTTALNRELTVLVQYFTGNGTNMTWSQNGSGWGVRHSAANGPASLLEFGSAIEGQAFSTVDDVVSAGQVRYRSAGAAGHGQRAAAFNSSEPIRTSRYGTAMYLFSSSGSSLISAHGIRRIAIISPRLTFLEQSAALQFWGS